MDKEAFDRLELVLTPKVDRSLKHAKDEVSEMLAMEILRRYYYQKGAIIYNLQSDNEINLAKETLSDKTKYNGMLNGTVLTHAGDRRYK